MSYHVYTTQGIVLRKKSVGEQSVFLHLLTEDLGLIIVSVRSTRSPKSKLRGLIEEYSHGYFSLIKSKNGWKLTNVSEEGNFFFCAPEYVRKTLAQISSVLIKMIQGEEMQKNVFELVLNTFESLTVSREDEVQPIEIIAVLRIMNLLGYVEKSNLNEDLLKDHVFDEKTIKYSMENKIQMVGLINKAIKESHL